MKTLYAFIFAALTLVVTASNLPAQERTELQRISDLEQDVQGLNEKIGHLNIQLEELKRENDTLRAQLAAAASTDGKSASLTSVGYVTTAQLDAQLANLRAEMMRAQTAQKDEIVDEVGRQMERLAQQTQQAIQAQAAATPAESTPKATDNRMGFAYVVEKGDTLSHIATRFGVSVTTIKDANSLTSDNIKIGQKLFIPQKTARPTSKK